MDDSVNVITSFGPQSLSLPPEQRKELIIVLTEGWSKEKFGIFTKPLLDRYSGQFRKKKGNYNPRPGPKKRLYDMVLKYEREEFELNDYIDFITEFDNRVVLQIRKNVLEDKLGPTDDQCKHVGSPIGKCCYICGYKINDIGGRPVSFTDKDGKLVPAQPLGSQCEHMVSVSELASLVGLYGNDYIKSILDCFIEKGDSEDTQRIHDITLEDFMENWFTLLLGDTKYLQRRRGISRDGYPDNYMKYFGKGEFPTSSNCDPEGGGNKDKGILMRWAHPACNQYKDNDPWVRLDWDPTRKSEWPIIDRDIFDNTDEGPIKRCLTKLWNGEPKMGKEWREHVLLLLGKSQLPLHINGKEEQDGPDKYYWIQARGENIQSLFTLFTDKVKEYDTIAHKYLLVAQEVLRYRTIQKSLPYYEKLFRSKLSAENFDKLINHSTSAISGGMRGGGSVKTPLDKLTLDQLGHLLTLSEGNNDKLLIKLNDKLNNAEVNYNSVYDTPLKSKQLVRTHTQSKRASYLPEFSKLDTNNTGLISKKNLLLYTIEAKKIEKNGRNGRPYGVLMMIFH